MVQDSRSASYPGAAIASYSPSLPSRDRMPIAHGRARHLHATGRQCQGPGFHLMLVVGPVPLTRTGTLA